MLECPKLGKVVQQIELPVLHHGADVGVDLPELSRLLEIFDQQLDRQTALHLELAVDAGPRFLQHLLRQVGGKDFDPPAGQRGSHFLQAHRQRIGLLPGRAGGAPDPDRLADRPRLQQFRHDRFAEMVERHLVAEEEGLVGGHGFDHLRNMRGGAAFHFLYEFADAGHAALAGQRQQAAFDQILLVCGQVQTGMIFQELTQILIVWRNHEGLSWASGKV